MDDTNRDLVSLISVILLLIVRQSPINITVQHFFARRHRRRRFQFRYLEGLSAFYLHLRARHELARWPRRAWVFPRPQNWFQQLLNNNALDHWWKENFRVSRDTFEYIFQLVGPALQRQNTRMRDAIAKLAKRIRSHVRALHAISCISYILLYDWPSHLREQINSTFQFRNCHGKFFCSF